MHNSPRLEYPPKRIAQLLVAIRSIPTSNPPQDIKYNFTCQFMTFHDFSIVLATIRCYTRNGRCVIFVGLGLYYLSVELAVQKHYNQWLSWHQGSCLARPPTSERFAPWRPMVLRPRVSSNGFDQLTLVHLKAVVPKSAPWKFGSYPSFQNLKNTRYAVISRIELWCCNLLDLSHHECVHYSYQSCVQTLFTSHWKL